MVIKVDKVATLAGHKDCIYTLEKSPDEFYFFSAGGDGLIVRWDINNPEIGDLIVKIPNSVYAIHCLPARNQLLVGQNFEGLHLIDLSSKKEIQSVKITASYIFDIQSWETAIFVACGDGLLTVLDLETLAVRKHIKASDKSARSIAINPQNGEFAVAYSDHFIRVFDLQSLNLKYTLAGHQNSVFSLTYSPDGNTLISGSRDAKLKFWDVNSQYQLKENIVAHLYAINHITFSPSGDYFATCSMDKSIKLWDYKNLRLLKVIDRARHAGHGTSVNKLFWSTHQGRLVSGSDDRTLSVWELKFGI